MNRRTRLARALVAAVVAALVAGLLTGCGTTEASSAADDVPALAVALGKVDDAMAARRYPAAQKLLRQLIADVRDYEQVGDLDDAAANDIEAAARALLRELTQRGGPATDLPSATTDGADDGDVPTEEATPRPHKSRKDEATPEPSPASTSAPTTAPSGSTEPLDPSPTAATEPATEESPAASEAATPAAVTSP